MRPRINVQQHTGTSDLEANENAVSGTSDLEASSDVSIKENAVSGDIPEDELFNPDKLKTTLYPLILSMKCFGQLYGDVFQAGHLKDDSAVPDSRSNSVDVEAQNQTHPVAQRGRCGFHFGLCYSVFIAGNLWLVLCYLVASTCKARDFMELLTSLAAFCWFLVCAGQHLLCLLTTSYRTKSCPLTRFDKFVKAVALVRARNISQSKVSVRNIMIIGWVTVIMNTVIVVTMFNYPDISFRNDARKIFYGNTDWTTSNAEVINYIYSSMHFFVNGNWIFPVCFYVSLCNVVTDRFNEVFERTSDAVWKKKSLDLASLRREYVKLCHVLSALDDILSPLGLYIFAVYIPLTCININVCIQSFDDDSLLNRIAYIFWNSTIVTVLLISSIAGARVNNSASRLSEILYDINIKDLDNKSEVELMLLLSNLNSNYTGLTVGGVVTITKEMILTVFGTILAYLTILIQFK